MRNATKNTEMCIRTQKNESINSTEQQLYIQKRFKFEPVFSYQTVDPALLCKRLVNFRMLKVNLFHIFNFLLIEYLTRIANSFKELYLRYTRCYTFIQLRISVSGILI